MSLKKTLDSLYLTYRNDYLSTDPLELVRGYEYAMDQELVAFIAAAFALGRVDLIRKNLNYLLNQMGTYPYDFIAKFEPQRDQEVFERFVYRFYRARDVGLLILWLNQIIKSARTIKAFFVEEYEPKEENLGPSLSRFVKAVRKLKTEPFYKSVPLKGRGIRHFLADPEDGSGCKRLNLFLRWMVRRDSLDLGLWSEIPASKLIIPLDTHIARLGRYLGLTKRKTPDWKMALEITESLKKFDPDDPVKYDFALCRVGMLNSCPKESGDIKCNNESCPVFKYCIRADGN